MDKQALRETVWDALEETGEARFPFPPHGRIPNFAGADEAADRLADTDAWRDAEVLKCNPDAPQLPVRRAALRAGKTVFMAVPRLREERCFLRLAPDEVPDVDEATTVSGSSKHGVPVHPADVPHVDLVVAGSVAVTGAGDRVGKGEGYSDLEWGVLSAFDRVDDRTAVATTVHELQVVDGPRSALSGSDDSSGSEGGATLDGDAQDGPIDAGTSDVQLDADTADVQLGADAHDMQLDADAHDAPFEADAHDVPLDVVCTPSRTIRCERRVRPSGVDWAALSEDRIAEMPVLARLQERGWSGR